MNDPNIKKYNNLLTKYTFVRRIYLTGIGLFNLLSAMLIAAFIYAVLDYLFGFSEMFRVVCGFVLVGGVVVWGGVGIWRISRWSNGHTSKLLDERLKHSRKELFSALQLAGKKSEEASPLEVYLIIRAIAVAVEKIKQVNAAMLFPTRKFYRCIKLLLPLLLFCGGVTWLYFGNLQQIMLRLIYPYQDIPPVSKLHFTVNPAEPAVIYGDSLEISAVIKGDTITGRVFFVTRDAEGNVHRSSCFRESRDSYTQKLEKVTLPLQFCFAVGKARSHWHKIKVLMQPKIMAACLTVTPPAYSALPQVKFLAGTGVLRPLVGSSVEMSISSNRPLRGGTLLISPADGSEPIEVSATVKDGNNAVFKWTAEKLAGLEFSITDLRGTKCGQTLKINQQLSYDSSPEVTLIEPDILILATPDAAVSLRVDVSDDLGIKRVDMVRAVQGYRDRIKTLPVRDGLHNISWDGTVELKPLGVAPGEIIEIYFEAFDYNPDLTGSNASDIHRIKVISFEEYAKRLRESSALRELIPRYEALTASYLRLNEAVNAAVKALDKDLSTEDKRQLLDYLNSAVQDAIGIFEKMTSDFPIYDIEIKHRKSLRNILAKLINYKLLFNSLSPDMFREDLQKKLMEVDRVMKGWRGQIAELEQETMGLSQVEEMMRQSIKLAKLVKEQAGLVRKLNIYQTDFSRARLAKLPEYGKIQDEIRLRLIEISKNLKKCADALSISIPLYQEQILAFLDELEKSGVAAEMRLSTENAAYRNGGKTYEHALLALEKLEKLLQDNDKKNNCVGNICRGKAPQNSDSEMENTLEQMLNAILGQGDGKVNANGGGFGSGPLNNGSFGSGNSSMELKIQGPARINSKQQQANRSRTGRGTGFGNAGKSGFSGDSTATESISRRETTRHKTESINMNQVPVKYRQAVKKYFGDEK